MFCDISEEIRSTRSSSDVLACLSALSAYVTALCLGKKTLEAFQGSFLIDYPVAAEVTAWRELQEVQGVDGKCLDTWDVAECAYKRLAVCLAVVDDEWTTALAVSATMRLALFCVELARFLDFNDIWACANGREGGGGNGGLEQSGGFEGSAADCEWDRGR